MAKVTTFRLHDEEVEALERIRRRTHKATDAAAMRAAIRVLDILLEQTDPEGPPCIPLRSRDGELKMVLIT